MSLKAMTWALEDAPVKDSTALVILWALADRAHDDGTAAWPSVQWLAHRARCTTRSVQRQLRALEDAGIIRKGDQRYVAHLRADHRPVVWDLNMTRRRGDNLSPREAGGVTPVTERGDTGDVDGVTPMTERGDAGVTQSFLDPSLDPSSEPTTPSPAAPSRPVDPPGFAEFWSHYPRKVGKDDARKAWTKAVRRADVETITAGVVAYAADQNLPETTFVPHPATWLNGGRWEDGPLPPRNGASSALSVKDRSAFSAEWADGSAVAEWEAVAGRPVR